MTAYVDTWQTSRAASHGKSEVLTQLHTPIPLGTPKGRGFAHFVIDYGQEHSIIWGVLIDSTREWWWVPNEEVLGLRNWSMQRRDPSAPPPVDQFLTPLHP